MAAQEPLSHSLLQQMGLADELHSLPGWGVLFYMADHHVYLLHKSLSDWLMDEGKSGKKHVVDVKKGHQFLGLHLIKVWEKCGRCGRGGGGMSGKKHVVDVKEGYQFSSWAFTSSRCERSVRR